MDTPSIILITVDHLRWNAWGDGRLKTPYLDGVARLGYHLEQAITSHQNPDLALDHLLTCVPAIQEEGCATALIGGDSHGLHRFEDSFDTVRQVVHNEDNPAHDIQEIGTQCVRFLQSRPDPLMLCAHFGMEDVSLATVDHQLGRMLAVLSAHGHTNATIIFTALSGEPGLDDLALLESRIRVPLIISGVRRQDRGASSPQFVSLADLVPTLHTIMGSTADIRECDEDLVPLIRGDIVGSLRAGACCLLDDGQVAVRSDQYILLGTPEGTVSALHRITDGKVDATNLVGDPKHVRVQIALTKVMSRTLNE